MLPKTRLIPDTWRQPVASVHYIEIESDSDDDLPPLKVQVVRRRSFLAAYLLGISPREYRTLKRHKAPRNFLTILHCHHLESGWIKQFLDLVDWFAGLGRIERAAVIAGLKARGFEINRDPENQNFVSDPGLFLAITWSKSTKPFSAEHWGTVCSSWVWQMRGVSGRSAERPMGFPGVECVVWGNCMVLGNII